MYTTSSNMLYR